MKNEKEIRFKDLFKVVSKKNTDRNVLLLAATQDRGIIPKSEVGYKTVTISDDNYDGLKLVQKGDFCITLRSFQGGIEYSEYDGGISSGYTVLRLKKRSVDKYFKYYLKNIHFISKLNKYKISIRDGQNIPFSDLGKEPVLFLDYDKQLSIANYLDVNISKIDNKIHILERKSILLEEYKNALIYETVTKGLDKNAEMKDSGVEWIGGMPRHWKIKRIKDYYNLGMGSIILKDDLIDDGLYPVYSATAEDKFFGYVNDVKIPLVKGDLVIPARGNSIGFVKKVENVGIHTCTQTTIYAKNKYENNNPYYYFYMIGNKKSIFFYDQTAIPQITVSQIKGKILLVPPVNEQKEIASFLKLETSKIEKQIELINRKVELLKEYKQSLIYEAVTGQLEIE
jgi:type I restriction enzyme S subunit